MRSIAGPGRWAAAALTLWALAALAADNPYHLQPKKIAADTYVFVGALENFDYQNNGNIVNTGFIVTDDGVVVIDTGPSRLYGEAMRAAIAQVTDQPVVQVYVTHAHPDHFLGDQAFADVPIAALPGTIRTIHAVGEDLANNLYYLVGGAMRGTRALAPTQEVTPGVRQFGSHKLELIAGAGHTSADLAILDHSTGVLFAGDLAFYQRAPTTPNADLSQWFASIQRLAGQKFSVLVPGHGPVARGPAPLTQTAAYLHWLSDRLHEGAAHGLSMVEMMFKPLPVPWHDLAVEPQEYRRSVSDLYPAIERAVFQAETKN